MHPVSWLNLCIDESVIDDYGYPQIYTQIEKMGAWGRYGIANSVPKYYKIYEKSSDLE